MPNPKNPSHPNNLPAFLSNFVGREREMSQIKQLLASQRLLTLTGPGGCGKTRLAVEVAVRTVDDYPDGTWLIELAPLSNPGLVPEAIASVLAVHEKPGGSITRMLIDHLRSREALLLIDNCEHLVAACASLAESLLQACPGMRIMVTSRESLGVPGEYVWNVPPLSLPEPQPWRNPDSAREAVKVYLESESVRLFVERASSVSPGFTITEKNAAPIVEICRRLDGMPLAIELAVARVRTLSVQQIAQRLDDRFHFLTSGSRNAPHRQRTLAATLDWSYALLSEQEQKVLQRLSIFAGGSTLDAVESVCVGNGIESAQVLDTLSHLVEKSLVMADKPEPGEPRYRMLETIRQYALEKLTESGELDPSKNRHLNYFVEWVETAEPYLNGAEQLRWVELYEAERSNLRAALDWSLTGEERVEAGLRLAAACGRFWRLHNYFSEGRVRFSSLLSHPAAQKRTLARASALGHMANLMYLQSDYPAMKPVLEEALSICRELGDPLQGKLAFTLELMGEMATEEGDYKLAPVYFQEALGIFRKLNDQKGIGDILMQLGWASMRTGDLQKAQNLLEESLVVSETSGNKTNMAFAFSGLGEAAARQGKYNHAKTLLEQGLSISREIRDEWITATLLGSLGWVALCQHEFNSMRKIMRESLEIRLDTGDKGGIAWCLEKLAKAKYEQDQLEQAAKLFGYAEALRAPIGSVIDPTDQPDYKRIILRVQSALGKEVFSAAWAEGQAMTLEQVIDYALAEPEPPAVEVSLKDKFGGLTAREREVAALIAQGMPNREIAGTMTVREKTIETYVTRILGKLGFKSRVEVATWAIEQGLKEIHDP